MKLLFTGFEPFNHANYNPSWEAVKLLPDALNNAEIHKLLLPVQYDHAWHILSKHMDQLQPDGVICVGQAGSRNSVTPEMVAINLNEAAIPDNAGVTHNGSPILPEGDVAYFSTLPVKLLVEALRQRNIPASVSYSAGTFVCNNLFYHLMHHTRGSIPAGFVHIPFECRQVTEGNHPSLPIETMCDALLTIAQVLAQSSK